MAAYRLRMEHWYVFHTKPHKERQVAVQLRQRRYEVFLPLVQIHRANLQLSGERPYFPCYLFARIDLALAGQSAVQWLPGLRQLVQIGGQPAIVSDHCVFELRRHLAQIRAAGGLRLEGLERGAAVRIVSGPFAGYDALFDGRLDGTERARVLLEWVAHTQRRQRAGGPARLIPLELNLGSIEKAGRKP